MNKKQLKVVGAMGIILFGIFVWPTLYKYDKMKVGIYSFPVRINRLTGNAEHYMMGGWVSQNVKKKWFRDWVLPDDESRKVTGNANFGYVGFSGKIYNGSSWTITEMVVRIVAKENDGSIRWDRKFRTSVSIPPLETESIYFDVTGEEGARLGGWYIDEIRGYK